MSKVLTSAMLSCPFCGCDDLETSPFPGNRERTFWVCRCGNPTCGAEIQGPTAEEAARRWNRSVPKRDAAYVYRTE